MVPLIEMVYDRTWAEVSMKNLEHNYRILREMIPASCRYLGVVKANAYGHGAVKVAQRLQELGADMLAVACLDEAIELRQAGVSLPVLCLGYTSPERISLLLQYKVTQTVANLKIARQFSIAAQAAGETLRVHINLDTGMTRMGFLWTEEHKEQSAEEIVKVCALPGLYVEGLYTHFAAADASERYTRMQLDRYLDAKEVLREKGVTFEIYHCASSAATLKYPETHLDMVRPGIAMYGYPGIENTCGLLPVMTLKSRVAEIRDIPKGTYVSYGCTAKTERDTRLAVLPVGYGDGIFRSFSNGKEVLLHGCRSPIVGRICMDMCMVDVTDVPDVCEGDVAVIFGCEDLMEADAQRANTISYEILSRIAPRVPRVYVDEY